MVSKIEAPGWDDRLTSFFGFGKNHRGQSIRNSRTVPELSQNSIKWSLPLFRPFEVSFRSVPFRKKNGAAESQKKRRWRDASGPGPDTSETSGDPTSIQDWDDCT